MNRPRRIPLRVLRNVPLGARNAVERYMPYGKPLLEKTKKTAAAPMAVFEDEPVIKEEKNDKQPFDDSFAIPSKDVNLDDWSEIPRMEEFAPDKLQNEDFCHMMESITHASEDVGSSMELVDNMSRIVLQKASEASEELDSEGEEGTSESPPDDSFAFSSPKTADLSDWSEYPPIENCPSDEVMNEQFTYEYNLVNSWTLDSSFDNDPPLVDDMPMFPFEDVEYDSGYSDNEERTEEQQAEIDQLFAKMEEALISIMDD